MKTKIKNYVAQPHDKFVRTMMSNPRVARDFFKAHLPRELIQATDLQNMKLQPRSYINDIRKETIVDILYKTTIGEADAYFYLLLEHQSTPDPLMSF